MKYTFDIKIICTHFPGNCFGSSRQIYLGVQKNKDILFETPGDSERREFEIQVTCNTGKEGEPNFLGPYVFGKTGDKFLYLVWYTRQNGRKNTFRRAKVKLNALSWEDIDKAVKGQKEIRVHIKMTDNKGGPICATVKGDNIAWEKVY